MTRADPARQRHLFSSHRPTALYPLLVFAINVILYIFTATHNQRLDVTRDRRFTLTGQSVELLQTLQRPIKVTGFFRRQSPEREQFEDLLRQYRHHSDHITYEVIDPARQPAVARQYHVTARQMMVVSGDAKEEKVFRIEERALTQALMKLTRKKKKVVYFTIGHGEPSLNDTQRGGYSLAKQHLQEQNYDVRELVLARHEYLPADAAAVIVAGLQTDLVESEIGTLRTYLENGGRVFIMVDPETATGLTSFLTRYGLTLGNDWVIETNAMGRLFGGDYHMPVITTYTQHPITKNLGSSMIVLPVVRSVRLHLPLPAGVHAQTLMSTSPQSWADTDLAGLKHNRSSFDEDRDQKGPISIAAVATMATTPVKNPGRPSTPEARLVVLGDSEFASNQFITIQGNGDFFLNAVNWLAEQEDLMTASPPTSRSRSSVPLITTRKPLVVWMPVVFLPLTVFVCGAIVCSRRR